MPGGLNFDRATRRLIDRENLSWPNALRVMSEEERRGVMPPGCARVMRSRDFLVQIFAETVEEPVRMSINRTSVMSDGLRWKDGITWDEIQRLKREAGFGDLDAVEIYPADRDVVNVANIRHIWILPAGVKWAWRKDRC